jgi:methylthioribose-1-phosphate isomerase
MIANEEYLKESVIKGMAALKDACLDYHVKHSGSGIGGSHMCVCGHCNGGSAACSGLGLLRNLIRYMELESDEMRNRPCIS